MDQRRRKWLPAEYIFLLLELLGIYITDGREFLLSIRSEQYLPFLELLVLHQNDEIKVGVANIQMTGNALRILDQTSVMEISRDGGLAGNVEWSGILIEHEW